MVSVFIRPAFYPYQWRAVFAFSRNADGLQNWQFAVPVHLAPADDPFSEVNYVSFAYSSANDNTCVEGVITDGESLYFWA